MYLSVVSLGFCFSYFILTVFFSLFFLRKNKPRITRIFFSVFLIGLLSLLINNFFCSDLISNTELSNRILHAFGGGFLAFLVCFLVVKDNNFSLNKVQFFLISALIVVALGVVNEIAEFFVQNYFGQIMAPNINDTWLDLISNMVGSLVASIFLVPFINISRLN